MTTRGKGEQGAIELSPGLAGKQGKRRRHKFVAHARHKKIKVARLRVEKGPIQRSGMSERVPIPAPQKQLNASAIRRYYSCRAVVEIGGFVYSAKRSPHAETCASHRTMIGVRRISSRGVSAQAPCPEMRPGLRSRGRHEGLNTGERFAAMEEIAPAARRRCRTAANPKSRSLDSVGSNGPIRERKSRIVRHF